MSDESTGAELAAVRLKSRAGRMANLLAISAPAVLLETEWDLIQQAYDELRHELEKKVSEG